MNSSSSRPTKPRPRPTCIETTDKNILEATTLAELKNARTISGLSTDDDMLSDKSEGVKLNGNTGSLEQSINDVEVSKRTKRTKQAKNVHQMQEQEKKRKKWSLVEKAIALRGLKLYGLKNMKSIAKMIGSKDERQVNIFLMGCLKRVQAKAKKLKKKEYYYTKKKEDKLLLLQAKSERSEPLKKNEIMALRINAIKKCMLNSGKEQPLSAPSALARALLMISKFETHPPPSVCEGVDFSAVYAFLSKVVSNQYQSAKEMLPNERTKRFIRSTFQQLIDMVPTASLSYKVLENDSTMESKGNQQEEMPSTSS